VRGHPAPGGARLDPRPAGSVHDGGGLACRNEPEGPPSSKEITCRLSHKKGDTVEFQPKKPSAKGPAAWFARRRQPHHPFRRRRPHTSGRVALARSCTRPLHVPTSP